MWQLLFANLLRKKLRLCLTLGSVAVSFMLFAFLAALLHGLSGGIQLAGQDRLMTMGQSSFFQPLPRSYAERIAQLDDVHAAVGFGWLGAYYREPRSRVPVYSLLNEASLIDVYPELRVDPAAWRAWMAHRSGALLGRTLAKARGWKVGDVIPFKTAGFRRQDGGNTWPVSIDGIFDNEGGNTNGLYIHYDYFNEALARERDTITWVALRVKDKGQSDRIAARIDGMFANSSAETKTSSEKSFIQEYANMIGNLGSIIAVIVIAVFSTMMLIAVNTMGQAVRERTGDIAVMKTVGFRSAQVTALVLVESLVIAVSGGMAGMGIGAMLVAGLARTMKQFMPYLGLNLSIYLLAFGFMVAAGLVAGALPCWQAAQLKITDALRRA